MPCTCNLQALRAMRCHCAVVSARVACADWRFDRICMPGMHPCEQHRVCTWCAPRRISNMWSLHRPSVGTRTRVRARFCRRYCRCRYCQYPMTPVHPPARLPNSLHCIRSPCFANPACSTPSMLLHVRRCAGRRGLCAFSGGSARARGLCVAPLPSAGRLASRTASQSTF